MPRYYAAGADIKLYATRLENSLTPVLAASYTPLANASLDAIEHVLRTGEALPVNSLVCMPEQGEGHLKFLGPGLDMPFLPCTVNAQDLAGSIGMPASPLQEIPQPAATSTPAVVPIPPVRKAPARKKRRTKKGVAEIAQQDLEALLLAETSVKTATALAAAAVPPYTLTSRAIYLGVQLSSESSFRRNEAVYSDVKIDIFLNGELVDSRFVGTRHRNEQKALTFFVSGRRCCRLAEDALVLHICKQTLGAVQDAMHQDQGQQWFNISSRLLQRAEELGRDCNGQQPPSADYLEHLAALPAPDCLSTCDGFLNFAIIDVILTLGTGKKRPATYSALTAPCRLLHPDLAAVQERTVARASVASSIDPLSLDMDLNRVETISKARLDKPKISPKISPTHSIKQNAADVKGPSLKRKMSLLSLPPKNTGDDSDSVDFETAIFAAIGPSSSSDTIIRRDHKERRTRSKSRRVSEAAYTNRRKLARHPTHAHDCSTLKPNGTIWLHESAVLATVLNQMETTRAIAAATSILSNAKTEFTASTNLAQGVVSTLAESKGPDLSPVAPIKKPKLRLVFVESNLRKKVGARARQRVKPKIISLPPTPVTLQTTDSSILSSVPPSLSNTASSTPYLCDRNDRPFEQLLDRPPFSPITPEPFSLLLDRDSAHMPHESTAPLKKPQHASLAARLLAPGPIVSEPAAAATGPRCVVEYMPRARQVRAVRGGDFIESQVLVGCRFVVLP